MKKRKIFNTILVFLLVILESTSLLLFVSMKTISKDNIKKIVKETSIKLKENEDVMYNIKTQIDKKINIDSDIVDKVLESEKARDIISDLVSNSINYQIDKDESKKITKEELYNLAENNIDEIAEESNYKLSETEKERLLKEVKTNSNEIINSLYNGDFNE